MRTAIAVIVSCCVCALRCLLTSCLFLVSRLETKLNPFGRRRIDYYDRGHAKQQQE